jgi:hypothetical protein
VEVRAARIEAPHAVDGHVDAAREAAPEAIVPLEGVGGPPSVRVRAAVVDGTLHLLLRWEDAHEDRAHRPFVLGEGGWKPGPDLEDQASVAFPMEGAFTADMLSPDEALWDVWHWKACRTDPAGHAQDRVHRMTFADPGGKRSAEPLADGRTLFIARPEDAGTPVTETLPAPGPEAAGATAPQFRARKPSGSAADVAARGTWSAGTWTLEAARALSTGHPDDRALAGAGEVPFAIAILDRSVDDDHTASGVLRLVLPPAPVAPPVPR